jgi:23S rRNA (cytidine1920-2'-O)/16S rRNA (cytidine1409-2'-O)-methyltransferase
MRQPRDADARCLFGGHAPDDKLRLRALRIGHPEADMKAKDRLDQLMVARGLAPSRTGAQALVRAGRVEVEGHIHDKPGSMFASDCSIEVRPGSVYVGRGAWKLVGALDAFGIEPKSLVCLDVGASTGGFTDVLLKRGAARVYAVDVGRGQLAWSLRNNPQVVVMERTDIRSVATLPEPIDLAVVDVAFISLRLVLPEVARLIRQNAACVALVKPQFEAGRELVGRGGVVKDAAVHEAVLRRAIAGAEATGFGLRAAVASPIVGAAGNREFFIHLVAGALPPAEDDLEKSIAAALAGDGDDTNLSFE